jgi:hypothetical protein
MKYFTPELMTKTANDHGTWTNIIAEKLAHVTNPNNDVGYNRILEAVREVEANRPLAPGKNPDPTATSMIQSFKI